MDTVRAAIIGLGAWGRKLVESVQGAEDSPIRFTAAFTRTPEKAGDFVSANGLKLYTSYEDLLNDSSIDVVVLATPHSQHANQVIAAAAHRKPIFVEKPFTLTRATALKASEACAQHGVVLAVGHNRRFSPALVHMKELVESGDIGKLLQIEGNISSNSGFRVGPEAWRSRRSESPAGGMTSLGIHLLDAMIHLCGPVEEVSSYSRRLALEADIDDVTTVMMKFKGGPLGYLGTVFASLPLWRIQVFGTAGFAEMKGNETVVVTTSAGQKERSFAPVNLERAELEAFANAVLQKSAYAVSVDDAVHGVSVLEAIFRSAEEATSIAVPA